MDTKPHCQDTLAVEGWEGLVQYGPPWNGRQTFECVECGGQFWRDLSLEQTVKHLEAAHGVMLGVSEIQSSILDTNGNPFTKRVPGVLFGSEQSPL